MSESNYIDFDKQQVAAFIDAMPKQIFQASVFAVAKTTRSIRTLGSQQMSAQLKVPRNIWRRKRGAMRLRSGQPNGLVWFGINDLKAAYAGKMRQDAHGAWSGQRYFRGAFMATMKSGHIGIFKRTGERKKLADGKWWTKIEEQTVDLNQGFEVADHLASEARIELNRQFIERVLQLNPYLANAQ